ncbi:hypothetical protein ZWY2020_024263 [Hordeum vulgare]|nr:hypothetical protein ZWY2020_024263 [Hordeum vulgare]
MASLAARSSLRSLAARATAPASAPIGRCMSSSAYLRAAPRRAVRDLRPSPRGQEGNPVPARSLQAPSSLPTGMVRPAGLLDPMTRRRPFLDPRASPSSPPRRLDHHGLLAGGVEAVRLAAGGIHDGPLLRGLLPGTDALQHPLPARLDPGPALSHGPFFSFSLLYPDGSLRQAGKLQNEALKEAITQVVADAKEKNRKFTETVELQIGLKNNDPQ